MPLHLSLYLDALRVLAALTVFLGHFAQGWLGGGLFWQATPFGHTAVLVFFVLSGYVIAFAADSKEHTLPDYTIARLSRILSVSVPAVLLAAVLLLAGTALNPEHYAELAKRGQSFTQVSSLGQFLAGLTFLGESWGLHVRVFGNTPYWSLAYEFWYYVIFGCLFYLRGNARILATGAACLVAGPKILFMAPLWAAGALAWHWRARVPASVAWPLAIGSAAAFVFLASRHGQNLATSFNGVWWPMEFRSTDHLLGLAIALHFAAVAALPSGGFTIPAGLANAVQNCAGYTFSIYLFHFPVLVFLGGVLPGPPGDHLRQALLFLGSALAIFALAQVSEKRRGWAKSALRRATRAWSPWRKTSSNRDVSHAKRFCYSDREEIQDMAETIENPMLEHLKKFQATQDRIERKLEEVNRRLSNLETGQATVIQHLGHLAAADASQQLTADGFNERLERIERRLEIAN